MSANKAAFYEQWRKCLLFEAPHDFDSYLTYMELYREASKRFYQPRKKQLKPVVDALQALCGDDELYLLAVSLPPGVGKTTLAIFLLTWIAGRDPNHPNLTGSHSNSFVRGVYSDYCNVGSKHGVGTPEFYAEMAKAFLLDKDAKSPKDKMSAYYYGIVAVE